MPVKTRLRKIRTIGGELLFRSVLSIPKKRRFIISALVLTISMLISSFFSFSQATHFIVVLVVLVYIFTWFSILEGVDRYEWLTLFIHPVFFSVVWYLFYFLLPGRWLTRLPYILIYGVSIYAIMLAQNIFNVGAIKNLQLYRAAFSINFLYLTITTFLAANLLLSFKFGYPANFVFTFILLLPLCLQFLWSIDPSAIFQRKTALYAVLIALFVAEIALVFSFVPVKANVLALLLSACFYSFSGLFEAYLRERLFRERIREYFIVLTFVFLVLVLSVRWG